MVGAKLPYPDNGRPHPGRDGGAAHAAADPARAQPRRRHRTEHAARAGGSRGRGGRLRQSARPRRRPRTGHDQSRGAAAIANRRRGGFGAGARPPSLQRAGPCGRAHERRPPAGAQPPPRGGRGGGGECGRGQCSSRHRENRHRRAARDRGQRLRRTAAVRRRSDTHHLRRVLHTGGQRANDRAGHGPLGRRPRPAQTGSARHG